MSRKRTVVGSWPRRRQLRGREAVERALALCKAWPPVAGSRVAFERDDSPNGAVARAFWQRWDHENISEAPNADWLPPVVRELSTTQLELLLAGGGVEGLAGQSMGVDEVAP